MSGWALIRGLRLEADWKSLLLALALTFSLMSIPISLNGHGVREWSFVHAFRVFGIGEAAEEAIAFSLLIMLVQFVWSVVGGIIYLFYEHQRKAVSVDLA